MSIGRPLACSGLRYTVLILSVSKIRFGSLRLVCHFDKRFFEKHYVLRLYVAVYDTFEWA